jgi:hypothetical protein
MDLATIQIKIDTTSVKAANDDLAGIGVTGKKVGKDVEAANDQMTTSAGKTTSAFKVLGGVMAALGVGALVSKFMATVTESEKLKGSLQTMTGSAENAGIAFQHLTKFASETPFTLDQSVQGFIKLKALGLDPSERALRSYGNTSAAMGKDMMQMIEAVADASTGEFERLKEFGIKASKQGDQVALTFQGVTTTIGNSSKDIQEYLLAIGETQFGTAMADQMKRLPGLLSNLEDNVGALFRKIGDVGGIKLFGIAISAASVLILAITNNLDILGTVVAATMAGFIAFSAGSIASSIIAGFRKIRTAILAMNTAIAANPIGFIASAVAIAATIIILNFDKIKSSAAGAAINIEIAWNKLKLFFLQSFAPALSAISGLFDDIQNNAIATWSAIAAAAKDPLNAIDTFNSTFDDTLEKLRSGKTESNVFGTAISDTESRIVELDRELSAMNTEVGALDDNLGDATPSLSDFAIQIDESAAAATEMAAANEAAKVKTYELLGQISNETEALRMSSVEIAIRNNLQKAGVDATSELGVQIVAATTQLYAEKDALDAASVAAKELEMQHDESQKAIEVEAKRVAEESAKAYETMKNNISGFFMDVFENGRNAFDNLAKSFKNMILQMIADWAASKVADMITGSFSGVGTSISSMFSGIFSSIGAGIASMASKAASVLTGGGGGGGAAATTAATNAATTAATTGGTGIVSTITSGLSAAGSAIVSGASAAGSAVLTALQAIPGWGWALGGAAILAKVLDSGGTMSSNAGMLTKDLGHAGSFKIAPFASGAQFTGFTRRADQMSATDNIDAFRAIDAYLTNVYKQTIGGLPKFKASDFIGYDEKGLGSGAFFGSASEEGGTNGTPMDQQLNKFAARWITLAGNENGVAQSTIDAIIGSGSFEEILANAGGLVATDGEHRDGLDFVPYDGYVAELHAGERVQTAQQARSSDIVAEEMASLRGSIEQIMFAVAKSTGKLYSLNDRWDKNGMPPVRA